MASSHRPASGSITRSVPSPLRRQEASPPRSQPLLGRVDIAQPALVPPDVVHAQLCAALGLPSSAVEMGATQRPSVAFDFSVRNARHIYATNDTVAKTLAADSKLRTALSRLSRCHVGKHFTFTIHNPHVTDQEWSFLRSTELFGLADEALHRIATQKPHDPAAVFAELVDPGRVNKIKRDLQCSVDDVVDLRIQLKMLEERSDATKASDELAEERQRRRYAEVQYQEAVQAEADAKAALERLRHETANASTQVKAYHAQIQRLSDAVKKLEADAAEKQRELDSLRSDAGANVDALVNQLQEAEAELAAWKARCSELERVNVVRPVGTEAAHHRAREQHFQAQQGKNVVEVRLRELKRNTNRSPPSDAARSSGAPSTKENDVRRCNDAAALKALHARLATTEQLLRERTLQLGQALQEQRA